MNLRLEKARSQTRRHFLANSGLGLGASALAGLQAREASAAQVSQKSAGPLAPKKPAYAARAKRVIYLHMSGAQPQHDLFDYKPKLVELNMQECPADLLIIQKFAFFKGTPRLLGTPYMFARHGKS